MGFVWNEVRVIVFFVSPFIYDYGEPICDAEVIMFIIVANEPIICGDMRVYI